MRRTISAILAILASAGLADAQEIVAFERFTIDQPKDQCRDVRQPVTERTNTICALTGVAGKFNGAGEYGRLSAEGDHWVFIGSSCQPGVSFTVTCFAIPQTGTQRITRLEQAIAGLRQELNEEQSLRRQLARRLRHSGTLWDEQPRGFYGPPFPYDRERRPRPGWQRER